MKPPFIAMYNAVKSLQERHRKALTEGNGWGLTSPEMAEHLEAESGFRAVYEALVTARTRMMMYGESPAEIDEIDAALAKANPVIDREPAPLPPVEPNARDRAAELPHPFNPARPGSDAPWVFRCLECGEKQDHPLHQGKSGLDAEIAQRVEAAKRPHPYAPIKPGIGWCHLCGEGEGHALHHGGAV